MKVRMKPIVVEVYQLKDLSYDSVIQCLTFMGQSVRIPRTPSTENPFDRYVRTVWENNGITIPTLEGRLFAKEGDYIIKGVHGEFYICKPYIFETAYEVLEDETK